MPMKARYTAISGQIVAEKRGGVRVQLVPDAIGSTVAEVSAMQPVSETFTYWPYGELLGSTGDPATKLAFCGTIGYRADDPPRLYVRARHYSTSHGRWTSVDPDLTIPENRYSYATNNPVSVVDPSGLKPANLDELCQLLKKVLGQIAKIPGVSASVKQGISRVITICNSQDCVRSRTLDDCTILMLDVFCRAGAHYNQGMCEFLRQILIELKKCSNRRKDWPTISNCWSLPSANKSACGACCDRLDMDTAAWESCISGCEMLDNIKIK